jgi:hypothetical protein
MCFRMGSSAMVSSAPPRLSSQFADHSIFMSRPSSRLFGFATGVCSPAGAFSSMSYSYVHGS